MKDRSPRTLVELLRLRAVANGDQLAYKFVEDSEQAEILITYAELDRKARAIAAELGERSAAGERALLLYPPGLDFIAAYFGCLYAGVTAVPIYPPRLNRPMPRIQAIVRDADARFALTTAAILDGVEKRFEHEPLLKELHWRNTELTPEVRAADWRPTGVTADDLAFLQYTSGSTSAPKGVMLTHGNLMHNLEMIRRGFHLEPDERGAFWLPSYHDMGLIGGILEPMYIGGSSLLISPVAFLQRPNRWLQGITSFKATITGAPNFAFDLCVDKITPEQRETVDLSSLKLCFSGAEPVRLGTLEQFAKTFGAAGFRKSILYPCYGLAEATLLVAGGDGPGKLVHRRLDREALKQNQALVVDTDSDGQDFVSCGRALLDEELRIVDPETLEAQADGRTGEIWVKGPHVARGYWGRPELSEHTFAARIAGSGEGPFLRTGDLGFMLDGELFITGRLKDLIIIRGKNHYPQDIEETFAAAHEAVEQMSVAAFSYEEDGEEKLAVVAEVTRQNRNPDMSEVVPALQRAVGETHGVPLDAIVLVKPLSIPKTSSGKIKRRETRQQFLDGELSIAGEWRANLTVKVDPSDRADLPDPLPRPDPDQAAPILAWLLAHLTARLKLAPGSVDPDEAFVTYGVDSAQAVSLTSDLEDYLGRSLSPTLAWDYPTPRQLAAHLAETGLPRPVDISLQTPAARSDQDAVAVIGLALRFPGASTPEAFWNLLTHGIDAVREVPADRFDIDAVYDSDPAVPGKASSRWGGFLGDVAGFDPQFFGISPREAARMDPQQRLLMETTWEALEAAGIAPNRLAGSATGVYIGISSYDYSRGQFRDPNLLDAYAGTGNAHSIAANRLSYFLDLRGPSLAVDTACSSSLVSVHMACRSLRDGETDLAIAGGVNLILSPELTVTFSQARMLSPDGRCKTFDARADGYVRGEGCGVVILKRLSEAVRDGDPILAVVQGTAVNQDGRTNGLTAPNGPSQEAVIRSALRQAGIDPHQVGYVEAHGTGTPLGDPIELHALRNVLAAGRPEDRPLYVGSVKTNIGHLEAAAGVAGLIKALLALHREAIPPHLHFEQLNPYIALGDAAIEIPIRTTPWDRTDSPRFAGVSSFGFGGTNAHIILTEAPLTEPAPAPREFNRPHALLALSARTPEALADLARQYVSTPLPELSDAAFTTQTGRRHFEYRLGVPADSAEVLRARLGEFLKDSTVPEIGKPKIAFLFTGQGAQYPYMTRGLFAADPAFRLVLETCAQLCAPHLDIPLLDLLFSEDDRIHQTRYAQPALFAVEYSMARMWQSWGIEPDFLLGHSIGEWTAACIAGVVSLEDALRLVCHRGRLMQSAPGVGGMLAVAASESDVAKALAPYADRLSIAAVNGPTSLAVSGDMDALRLFAGDAEAHGWTNRFLNVSHGFHSPLMEPVLAEFRELLSGIQFKPPRIPIAANADGNLRTSPDALDADYWVRHIRNGIRFADGIDTLLQNGAGVFLEAGPKPVLLSLVRRILAAAQSSAVLLPTADDSSHDWEITIGSLGRLYELGCDIDWTAFNAGFPARKVSLPAYPFQRERYWIETASRTGSADASLSAGRRLNVAVPVFEQRLPAVSQTVLLELALAAGRTVFESPDCAVREVRFDLPRPASGAANVQTVLTEVNHAGALFSILAESGDGWVQLAAGSLVSGRTAGAGTVRVREIESGVAPDRVHVNGDRARHPQPSTETDLEAFLSERISGVLGIPQTQFPLDRPLNQLGLDSLMAIEVRNAVEKRFNIELPLVDLLEGPSAKTLAEKIRALLESHATSERIEARDPGGEHPLSVGQQALWFLHELTGEDTSFNISGAVKITGPFDPEIFRTALDGLVSHHPALTTVFRTSGGRPVQALNPDAPLPLVELDARSWVPERIALYLRREAWRKFNLESGPPFRVRVLTTTEADGSEARIVLFSVDHIVADFWSVSLIVDNLLQAYQFGKAPREKAVIEFVDAVRWLNAGLESEASRSHLAYWKDRFANGLPVLNLPTDRPRPPLQTFQGETVFRRFPVYLSNRLQALAQAEGTTLFNVLLAAFDVLLHRYSGQDEFVVGSVMAGRDRPELENLVGYLLNPVALKADFSGAPTYRELLLRTRRTVLEAFEHQAYPPALLAEKLDLPRDHSRPPLFETMFILQKAHMTGQDRVSAFAIGLPGAKVNAGGLDMEIYPVEGHPAQFDLTLMMAEVDDALLASMQFNTALFNPETIDRMLAHLERLLEGITEDPDRPAADYPLPTPDDLALMDGWNRTAERLFPFDQTLVDLFAVQAQAAGDRTAVKFADRQLTYSELDARAARLAAHLISLGVGPGTLVGVHMRRSLELPEALLGILKAGGAYVPLDPAFPAARIAFMIEDSKLEIVLADADLASGLPGQMKIVVLSELDNGIDIPAFNLQPGSLTDPEQLAYVIYTSGSTGKPKGVQIPHRAVVNFMCAMQERPGITPGDVLLAVTTLSFDISVLEIFLPLVTGAQLIIAGDDLVKDGGALAAAIEAHHVTLMQATPSTWRLVLESGWKGKSDLRIFCGGEAMPGALAADLLPRCRELWNMYGPTETTIWSTVMKVESPAASISIGAPIANTAVYILDEHNKRLPPGVFGELGIAGRGLARGYLDRPDLTAEKFIEVNAERVYRTGDLARLLADGRLDFAGRRDSQVKVRGYRIELGEIETLLNRLPGIRQAVVDVQGRGTAEARLIGYIVAENEAEHLEVPELRRALLRDLPEYMVPAVFVFLENLPLTPNGKVDRKSLPSPDGERPVLATEYVAPRNEIEERLAALCAETLGLEQVGVRDNFFDLGGTSLQATRLVFKVRESFGRQILLRRLFEDPTVEGLAAALEEAATLSVRGYGILAPKSVAELAAEVVLEESIRANGRVWQPGSPQRVLLTGATGYLGAFLLRELLDGTEADVLVHVRASSEAQALERVRANLESYGLWDGAAVERILPLPGDLEAPGLGLSEHKFADLAGSIDAIYHNGARVNFVQSYEGHKPANVLGTHEVLRLAGTDRLKPVHFVSTLSVFHTGEHDNARAFTETDKLEETGAPLGGYAQSKWVAERLVQEAAGRGIPAAIYRPGIISGHSETGAWNNADLVWGLARACFTLGKIPRLAGTVDVVPVDYVSKAIVHLSLNRMPDGRAYHLGNPGTYPFEGMVKVIQELGLPVDEVPFEDWREALFRHSLEGTPNDWNTFLPIIEEVEVEQIFMPRFDASNTLAGLAGTAISCPPVGPKLLGHYLEFFNQVGFFSI